MEGRFEQRVSGDMERYRRHLYHIDDAQWERSRPSRSRKRESSQLSRIMLSAKLVRISQPLLAPEGELDFGCFFYHNGECIRELNGLVCTCKPTSLADVTGEISPEEFDKLCNYLRDLEEVL